MPEQTTSNTSGDNSGDNQTPTPREVANRTSGATSTADNSQREQKTDYQPPASQEELDRIIEARLNRQRAKFSDYEELKAKAAKFDQAKDAEKTAEQRAAERISALEQKLHEKEVSETRARVAAGFKLSPDLLAGSTEEELTAHAEKIAAAIEAAKQATPTRGPQLSGEGNGKKVTTGDWLRNAFSSK